MKFYKTTYTFSVLSDRPTGDMELEDIARETQIGDMMLQDSGSNVIELTREEMIHECEEAGGDPGFFGIED